MWMGRAKFGQNPSSCLWYQTWVDWVCLHNEVTDLHDLERFSWETVSRWPSQHIADCYGIWRFISMLSRVTHWTLSFTRWTSSFFKIRFNIILPFTFSLIVLSSSYFLTETLCVFLIPLGSWYTQKRNAKLVVLDAVKNLQSVHRCHVALLLIKYESLTKIETQELWCGTRKGRRATKRGAAGVQPLAKARFKKQIL